MLSEKGKGQRNLQNIHSFKPKKKNTCVFLNIERKFLI